MFFPFSGAQVKFFRAKTRSENVVGMLGTEVGALFRVRCPPKFPASAPSTLIITEEERK
jgi:hypothetical protein